MTIPQTVEPVVAPAAPAAGNSQEPQTADTKITLTLPDADASAKPTPDPVDPKDGGKEPSADPAELEAFKFDVPETMSLDEGSIAKLSETARELNLTSDQVQKLLESVAPSMDAANTAMLKETREGWAKEIADDLVLGGSKLPENMAIADKAVKAFGDEGLQDLLNAGELPLGKEPRMFRFLVKIGAAISEAKAVTPGVNGKPGPKPITGDVFQNTAHAASIMYPNQQE